ncbi:MULTISPECIES: DMT family transporter [unclassified Pseudomonas]|uniref:DMT family transporter n=1 Tax=unclassified Pseudomonas TaxID=196821 RepID=UPI000BA3D8EB|nr:MULTISPECIES: multidrug efflux SMR transporter [unclassified Pseudomonas]MCU1725298.1 multidrug efflux SMR transporter [Pseudomonas sp. 5P_5.1_Bac1]MCU1730773.1 multidrug efflux SMR transporter [Pseudomonas sp. 20P_3.2_Bac4]MCU1742911.1 multidrug efflux SMR transporter [Pseudomonas sp. 20P_3.2_Bac5]
MGGLNGWGYLIFAGVCEVFYASIIPRTEGFTRLWPSLYCGFFLALSIYLLSLSVRELPLGLAYAVWVGIGTLGTVVYGSLFLGESLGVLKGLCLLMIVGGIVGLKLVGEGQAV